MLPDIKKWMFIAVLATPPLWAGDLSSYREFQLGMSLNTVEKQVNLTSSETKVVHEHPALIQELEWQPRRLSKSSPDLESIDAIQFSFYNGQLFRMIISYDRYKTEGLTAEDLVQALSAQYGSATMPAVEIPFPSAYGDKVKVIARWEDAQHSFNLVRRLNQPNFALVAFSKRLDALAQGAITEAVVLEQQQAPQREIERQNREIEQNRIEQEKARLLNKPGFRP
jgi:hypothetical protein